MGHWGIEFSIWLRRNERIRNLLSKTLLLPSWNHFQCNIEEKLIKETADAIVSTGLAALGYHYVNLDVSDWYGKLEVSMHVLLQKNLLCPYSWVNDEEGSRIHCPTSAMHMLGFAPIKEMLEVDVCVSLGTDGAIKQSDEYWKACTKLLLLFISILCTFMLYSGRDVFHKGITGSTVLASTCAKEMERRVF